MSCILSQSQGERHRGKEGKGGDRRRKGTYRGKEKIVYGKEKLQKTMERVCGRLLRIVVGTSARNVSRSLPNGMG